MRVRHRAASAVAAGILIAAPVLVPGHTMAAVQPTGITEPLARLDLDTLSPRVVTTASSATLSVTGRIVNIGDRSLDDLAVRVQRDDPLTDLTAATTAVLGTPQAPYLTEFTVLDAELQPGQSTRFALSVPLSGGSELESLQLTEPGVYPLLVNVNGVPDFGGRARVASVPLLLPVLGLPAVGPDTPPVPPPPPGRAVPTTILWPLTASTPRLPSGSGEPVLLASAVPDRDAISTDVAPGGRLDGLLAALEQVVPPGSPLAGALCVAVDPELIETVAGMAAGYEVALPNDEVVEGSGSAAAQRWLDRLRTVVQGRCVLPLPYADPDLVALSRAGLVDLQALATSVGGQLVADLLGVQPLDGVIWPAGGVLDERTLSDLASQGTRAVIVEPRGVSPDPGAARSVTLGTALPSTPDGVLGVLADPLLTDAFGPATTDATTTDAPTTNRPTGTEEPLAAQDAIGALAYRALTGDRQELLVAPPRRWLANPAEAREFLATARDLVLSGFLVPRDLPGVVEDPSDGPADVSYPVDAGVGEIPATVTSQVLSTSDVVRDLQGAMQRDATADLEPTVLLDPVRLGLLRAMSTAWRDQPSRAADLVVDADRTLADLRLAVSIAPPPGPYSLASTDSPLLVTVLNDLPVTVLVEVRLSRTPGLTTSGVGVVPVPARSNRQLVVPAEVTRAGRFAVDANLTTPGGTRLGDTTTLQLRSSTVGTVTVVLTVGAAAVLVLLVARRIVRRVRGARPSRTAGENP